MHAFARYFRAAPAALLFLTGCILFNASFSYVAEARGNHAIRRLHNVCDWNKLDWRDMNATERGAWSLLGMDAKRWASDDTAIHNAGLFDFWHAVPAGRAWEDLTPQQRSVAISLGFGEYSWDFDCK